MYKFKLNKSIRIYKLFEFFIFYLLFFIKKSLKIKNEI